MRVHVHTLCWNDMAMLPFFFRHYEPWVERFYLFDDGSTDGTREFLESRNDVVVAPTPHADTNSWVRSAQAIHNTRWKRSIGEADWVVVTNVDEHLHHSSVATYLVQMYEAGITALPAAGYQMVTSEYPAPDSVLWRDHTMGAPDVMYSRMALFRPDRIRETNYTVGRHCARLEGDVVFPARDEIANLHYKHLGASETFVRQTNQGVRLGATDLKNRWGAQYQWSEAEFMENFRYLQANSVDVSAITDHNPALCWWRYLDDWRKTPVFTGRCATEQDVKTGVAAFCITSGSKPHTLSLPACAIHNDAESGEANPVIIIQAEASDGMVVVGARTLEGEPLVCLLSEVQILDGPDERFLTGASERPSRL